jgi:hypothetical protein
LSKNNNDSFLLNEDIVFKNKECDNNSNDNIENHYVNKED